MNDRRDSPPAKARRLGLIAAGALVLTAFAGSAAFANDTPGNNGTVKIHEGAGEPASEVRNEPHVCTFHLHFFFGDPEQAGTWEIQRWAPGDNKGTVVLAGTYDTAGDGEDRQPESGAYGLPNGHYKLFWDGDTGKHDKMKVFWVDCEEGAPTLHSSPPGGGNSSSPPGGGNVPPTQPGGDTTGQLPGQDLAAGGAEANITPPPTDTESVDAARTQASWPIILLIIATILVTASFLRPVKRDR